MAYEEMITEAQAQRIHDWAREHGHTKAEADELVATAMGVRDKETSKKESPETPTK